MSIENSGADPEQDPENTMQTHPQHRFISPSQQVTQSEMHEEMIEDPLLIAQSLTFVTDDGEVSQTFGTAPFGLAFKFTFFFIELIFVAILIIVVPIGYHATVISISVGNLAAVAWFWYNSVRSVDVSHSEGLLRFWIGNFEVTVPFDSVLAIKPTSGRTPCSIINFGLIPHRGYLSNPRDGVAIMTRMPTTPFWSWPRSAEGLGARADRRCCMGLFGCPRLVIVFSPEGGASHFIREVEYEMEKWEKLQGKREKKKTAVAASPTNPDFGPNFIIQT
jgi:hypothetical protein